MGESALEISNAAGPVGPVRVVEGCGMSEVQNGEGLQYRTAAANMLGVALKRDLADQHSCEQKVENF